MNPSLFSSVLLLLSGADGIPDTAPPSVAPIIQIQNLASVPTESAPSGFPTAGTTDGRMPTVWVGGEYLMWWTKKSPNPYPLITQGDEFDAIPGAIGQPGTSVLFGDKGINYGMASGLRLSAGLLLSADAGVFLEGSYFRLERRSTSFGTSGPGSGTSVVGQSIISADSDTQASELVTFPNPLGFGGALFADTTTRLQGWDTNLGYEVFHKGGSQLVLLAGFRSLDLQESLTITTNFHDISGMPGGAGLTFLGLPDVLNSNFVTQDRFQTSNQFYGGQVGARFTQELSIFSLSMQAKCAFGSSQEVVTINGFSSLQSPGVAPITVPGGVLALPSNMGRYYRSQFAVVPEGTVSLGVQLATWCRASVGYNFLYWSEVARPGNQIDPVVNRFAVPTDQFYGVATGTGRPTFNFQGSDYWAQGITFGLEFRF